MKIIIKSFSLVLLIQSIASAELTVVSRPSEQFDTSMSGSSLSSHKKHSVVRSMILAQGEEAKPSRYEISYLGSDSFGNFKLLENRLVVKGQFSNNSYSGAKLSAFIFQVCQSDKNPRGLVKSDNGTCSSLTGSESERAVIYEFEDDSIEGLRVEIFDNSKMSPDGNMSHDFFHTALYFIPRKVKPTVQIDEAKNRFYVTLPTGEHVVHSLDTNEIINVGESALHTDPIDYNPSRHTRKFSGARYTGEGVAIRCDARGGEPELIREGGVRFNENEKDVSKCYLSHQGQSCAVKKHKLFQRVQFQYNHSYNIKEKVPYSKIPDFEERAREFGSTAFITQRDEESQTAEMMFVVAKIITNVRTVIKHNDEDFNEIILKAECGWDISALIDA